MIHRRLLGCALLLASAGALAQSFKLSSPTIKPGATLSREQVYNGFGCSGGDRSPALKWTPGPQGTQSYEVTLYDPDAPSGSGWWHWIVYDIPATTHELPAGAGNVDGKLLPAGTRQARNDFGAYAYGGACPPKGDKPHRYVFTVYALKVGKLDVPADASAALIGFVTRANSLAKASLKTKYGR